MNYKALCDVDSNVYTERHIECGSVVKLQRGFSGGISGHKLVFVDNLEDNRTTAIDASVFAVCFEKVVD